MGENPEDRFGAVQEQLMAKVNTMEKQEDAQILRTYVAKEMTNFRSAGSDGKERIIANMEWVTNNTQQALQDFANKNRQQ